MADTGWHSPTANGEDYNQWNNPANAYVSNNQYATPPGAASQHDYYNFTLGVPAGAAIDGIEVSLEGHALNATGATITIELSWDSGPNYTATGYAAAYPGVIDETDILGGPADTWGRIWSAAEFSNANLRARVDAVGSAVQPSLDHIQVRVYYTEATTTTTTTSTTLAPGTTTSTTTTSTLAPETTSTTTSSTTTLAPTTTSTTTTSTTTSHTTSTSTSQTTSTSTLSTTSTTTLPPCDVVVAVARTACRTSIGNQDITTADLGGRIPKAAFFIVTGATSDGVPDSGLVLGMGAATGTSERWALCVEDANAVTTTQSGRRGVTDECVLILHSNSVNVDGEADLVSFITNGVRINWGNAPFAAYLLTVVFFAGENVTAKASTFGMAVAQDATVDVNTVGFEPEVLLLGGIGEDFIDSGFQDLIISHGIALNKIPVEQYCWGLRSEAYMGISTIAGQITDNYGSGKMALTGNWVYAGEYGTFDAQGFSCTTRLGGSNGEDVGYLALAFSGTIDVAGGIIDSPVANGNQGVVAPSFTPQYVHVGLTQFIAVNTAYTNDTAGSWGISTFDADDEYCNSAQSEDNQGISDTQCISDNTAVNLPDDDGSAGWLASLVSFDMAGWTWNFTQSHGTAVKWWYLAIGPCVFAPTTTTTSTSTSLTTSTSTTSTTTTTTRSTTSTTTIYFSTTTLASVPTTPTREQSLSLTINVFKPDFSAGVYKPRGTFVTSLQEQVNSYSHQIKAFGGYWSAKFTVLDKQQDMEDWFINGLGRHVEMYDNALVKIWEGFVNQVSLTLGGLSAVRGPLLNIGNKVYVVYSGTSTATDPPVSGNRVTTAPAENLESQSQYGIIEQILSAGGMTQVDAEQARDTYLAENKLPKTTQKLGSGGGLNVAVSCLGYSHWLNYLVSLVGVEGTVNLDEKLNWVLDADPNGLFLSSNADITPNTLQVPAYDEKSRTAWDVIKELTVLGDEDDNRYTFGVYSDREAVYKPAIQDEISYRFFPGDPARRIESAVGGHVWPWNVLPARWMFFPSFLVGQSFPDDWRLDPRFMFVETATFRAPSTVQLQGGRLDTITQKLAKMGLAGIGA